MMVLPVLAGLLKQPLAGLAHSRGFEAVAARHDARERGEVFPPECRARRGELLDRGLEELLVMKRAVVLDGMDHELLDQRLGLHAERRMALDQRHGGRLVAPPDALFERA